MMDEMDVLNPTNAHQQKTVQQVCAHEFVTMLHVFVCILYQFFLNLLGEVRHVFHGKGVFVLVVGDSVEDVVHG
jgi:hypothetical protein